MVEVLIGTPSGCRVLADGAATLELEGRAVGALTRESCGGCLAVVDDYEILRRRQSGAWSLVARSELPLVALTRAGDRILAGSIGNATVIRAEGGECSPLCGFAEVPGRESWFGEGPPSTFAHWLPPRAAP